MTADPIALGLDAGGSGTGWALVRGGSVLARGQAPPLTAALLGTPAGEAAMTALTAALPARPEVAHAGLPGLQTGSAAAETARSFLAAALDLPPACVLVEGDLDLAYRAHFAPGAGVLLYAGTGSIAYHVTAPGEVVRAGGRGYRLGDDGGGFSLGRAALRWVTDRLDGGEVPASPLAAEVAALTGGLDWPTLRAFAYGTPGAAGVASLAPAVGRAADAGDPVARALLTDAAHALADLARRVLARTGPLPLRATGGALRVSPLLPGELTERFPGLEVVWRDHAEAAARRALEAHP